MSQSAVLLTTLSVSDRARIVRIDAEEASQLSGFGLYRGAMIEIHQTFPTYIVRTDQTEIALESDVAGRILVDQVHRASSRGRGGRRRRRRHGGFSW